MFIGVGVTFEGFSGALGVSVSISGLTDGAAQHNVQLTVNVSGGTASAIEWQEDTVAIGGATASTFTPVIGTNVSDAGSLRCKVTVDGQDYFTTAYEIRYAAGSVAGLLEDQYYLEDSAISAFDPTGDFTTTNLTITWSATGLPTGLSINSGTGLITGTPTIEESGAVTVTATDQYSRTLDSQFSIHIANVPDQMSAPTVVADSASQVSVSLASAPADNNAPILQFNLEYSSNAGTDWTEVSDVSLSTPDPIIDLPAGTQILVRTWAVNAIGAGAKSANGSATTEASALTLNSASFTNGAAGSPPEMSFNYDYDGSDDIRVRGVTSTATTPPSKADITAGTGTGSLEEFTGIVSGGTITLDDALTAASETATRVHVFLEEDAGSAESAIETVTVSGLDGTAPALTPASCTPADGGTGADLTSDLTAIFDSTVYAGTGNFYLRNVTDGTTDDTVAIGSCTIGTTDVVIPFADRTAGKDYAVRWDAGVVVDAWANDVAANTGDTLWNFTAPSSGAFTDDFSGFSTGDDIDTSANYTELAANNAGKIEVNASSQIELDVAAGNNSGQRVTYTGSLSGDQYAQIDLVELGAAGVTVQTQIFCCVTDDDNYYQLRAYGDGNWNCRKNVAASFTTLASGSASDFANGDTMILERDSTAETVVIKRIRSATPTTLATATSETSHTSGSAGLGFNQNGSSTTKSVADNFEAGDL